MAGDDDPPIPPIPFGPGSPGYGPGASPPVPPPQASPPVPPPVPAAPEPSAAPEPQSSPPLPDPLPLSALPAPVATPAPAPSTPVPPPQASPPATPPGGWDTQLGRPAPPPKPDTDRLAGWGTRFAAQMIDFLMILIPGGFAGLVAVGAVIGDDDNFGALASIGIIALFVLVFILAGLFYGPLLMRREGQHNGQTLGKQMLGITVIHDSGAPFGFWSAAYREVGLKGVAVLVASFIIPIPFVPFLADYLWPLWDGENRALHDIVGETHVVRV